MLSVCCAGGGGVDGNGHRRTQSGCDAFPSSCTSACAVVYIGYYEGAAPRARWTLRGARGPSAVRANVRIAPFRRPEGTIAEQNTATVSCTG